MLLEFRGGAAGLDCSIRRRRWIGGFVPFAGEGGGEQEDAAEAHLRAVRRGRGGGGIFQGHRGRERAVAARSGVTVQARRVGPGERVGGEGRGDRAGGEPGGRDARALRFRRCRTEDSRTVREAAVD